MSEWSLHAPRGCSETAQAGGVGEPVLVNAATVVRLSARLADPELARARALYPAEDFTQWGIGEVLVSAPLLKRRFADAEEVAPVGWALVRAAIDWRRAGLVRPIPLSELSALYPQYLEAGPTWQATRLSSRRGLRGCSSLYWMVLPVCSRRLAPVLHERSLLRITSSPRPTRLAKPFQSRSGSSCWIMLSQPSLRGSLPPHSGEGTVPSPSGLGSGGCQVFEREHAPTFQDDALGFEPLVKGLRDLLNHRDTGFPLAIAVTAPWGGGKSSAMLQLRRLLDAPPEEAGASRRWYSVQFEAWKYEQSERLWAALAKAIYDQPQGQMTLGARIRFRLRLELERYREQRRYGLPASDEEREPRRVPRARLWWEWSLFLLKGVLPPAITLAIVAVAITKLPTGAHDLAWWLGGLAFAATLVAAAGRNWGVVSDPFKRAINRYVRPSRLRRATRLHCRGGQGHPVPNERAHRRG